MFSWCWSWISNTLTMWWEQMKHWKRPWCWERLRAEGKEGDRGWDGWMVSLIQWIWTWVNSGRWGGTGKPGVLQSMELWRVGHNLATEQQQKDIYIYLCVNWLQLLCFFLCQWITVFPYCVIFPLTWLIVFLSCQAKCMCHICWTYQSFFFQRRLDLSYSQKAFVAWRL